MAKSSKAKKEKKKDFQKAKLKVGKGRAKPSNATDTSFKARSINVLQQSLSISAPSASSQFSHHLSLLSHKSESQRKDSLSHITSALQSSSKLPQPASMILPRVLPLVIDTASVVRSQAVKLLEAFPPSDVRDNAEQLLLYGRAAITHLSTRVRLTGLDLLEWLLNVAGQETLSCPGGWVKTLNCLLALLGWTGENSSTTSKASGGWKSSGGANLAAKSEDEVKVLTRELQVFSLFLETGLVEGTQHDVAEQEAIADAKSFPLWQTRQHLIPRKAIPFAYLNLFGSARDEESERYETTEDRAVLYRRHATVVAKGVERMKSDGGGVGRAAMGVERVLNRIDTLKLIDLS